MYLVWGVYIHSYDIVLHQFSKKTVKKGLLFIDFYNFYPFFIQLYTIYTSYLHSVKSTVYIFKSHCLLGLRIISTSF